MSIRIQFDTKNIYLQTHPGKVGYLLLKDYKFQTRVLSINRQLAIYR